MIRAYYAASDVADWDAAGRCVGPGYVWIDHATGVEARSAKELYEAQVDADAWSDTRIEIKNSYESGDGTVIVQGEQTSKVTGTWRGMETTGQPFSLSFCTIFRFDGNGLIIHEETYYDMLSVRRQLGY
jgi:ketosteroid isomerase-like protein